jgi:hypothetical protein
MRVIGLTVAVIGWLYFFGGRSGARQFIAASVIDRLIFVPAVLIPLAIAAVFPRLFLTFTIIDALLAIGAWVLLARELKSVLGLSGHEGASKLCPLTPESRHSSAPVACPLSARSGYLQLKGWSSLC